MSLAPPASPGEEPLGEGGDEDDLERQAALRFSGDAPTSPGVPR